MFDKCPNCGKGIGTFGSGKKIRCDYCQDEGCTSCFLSINKTAEPYFVDFESLKHYLQSKPSVSSTSKNEIFCCHKNTCFSLFLESIDPFFRSREILEKTRNEPHLQRMYINITLRKVRDTTQDGRVSYMEFWDGFKFMEYSLLNRLFIEYLQENKEILTDFFETTLSMKFKNISKDIQQFPNYNEVLTFFGNILPLKLVQLFIDLGNEKYDLCLQNIENISDLDVKDSLRVIFYGLKSRTVTVAESGLNSLGMQNINPRFVEAFSELVSRKIGKQRAFSERNLRSSHCFLSELVDLALKDYKSSKKSLNSVISLYILAKTGAVARLDVADTRMSLNMGRKVHAQRTIFGTAGPTKSIDLGAYYFYVNALVCSHKWDQTAAQMVRLKLGYLASALLDGDYDLERMFRDGLRFIPFGEEAAYAFKSIVRKRMLSDSALWRLPTFKHFYEDSNIDQLTAIHILYFDLGRDLAKKYIGWWSSLLAPKELKKLKKMIKNPGEISGFIESIDPSFAEECREEWRSTEKWGSDKAKDYRVLSLLHYLYPELIRSASSHSKGNLIEKLNKKLANFIYSDSFSNNWEILYILRIFELIGENLSFYDP